MAAEGHDGDEPLPAGDFSAWLAQMQAALRGDGASDVPCGTCTACCTSSQFVHIGPEEADTLAHIPRELLFPAPGLPAGNVLLGYDERGHCPMLVDGGCSIYAHRPRTCRTYDCRIFTAAGVSPEADSKPQIAERVRRWAFTFPGDRDRTDHTAVRAAAAFLAEQRGDLSDSVVPADATRLAVMAIRVHATFVGDDGDARRPPADVVHPAVRDAAPL